MKLQVIQGLLIDPLARTAEIVSFTPDLDEFYRLLQCEEIGATYVEDDVTVTYIERMPGDFYQHSLGGIPCTTSPNWTQPLCGRLLLTGPPDEEGECTSITDDQVKKLIAHIQPTVWKVRRLVDGGIQQYPVPRGFYEVQLPSLN